MARNSIGLDIGTRAVRLAEVQMAGGTPAVTGFGRILLPMGAVEHGEIRDPAAVGAAISALWKRLGLSGRSVHVGLANRRVVVRTIDLPAMRRDDLEGAIRFQAAEHIPIPLDEAVMDYEILEEVEGPEGEKLQRVMVVAAERSTIEPLMAAVRAARLDVGSVELNAYPLVRCFGTPESGTEAIVDIGAGVTSVVVHRDGKIRFTRMLPTIGGDDFTSVVAQALDVSFDEAETLKREASKVLNQRASQPRDMAVVAAAPAAPAAVMSPAAPTAGVDPLGYMSGDEPQHPTEMGKLMPIASEPVRSPKAAEVGAGVIEPLMDRLVAEIRGSLDFYAGQADGRALDRVVLTGGGSLLGGLSDELRASVQVPVLAGRPFKNTPIGKVDVSDEERAVAEPFMGVAVGLALAGVRR